MSASVHPTAIVDASAELGDGVRIGAYSIVGPNVKLGAGCRVGPHVVIEGCTTLGKDNEVFQFASLGSAPQDLKYKGEPTTLIIGDGNKIREYVTLQPGTITGTGTTIIGSKNLFMANSHVGHDSRIGDNNVFANAVSLAGHVSVSHNVILGGMAGVHQFCRVGDFAMLSAGSMVAQDMPPYCIGQGDRCKIRGLNLIGLERGGMTPEEIAEIKRVYRRLFRSVGRLKEKIAELPRELVERPRIKLLLDFIAGSKRGTMSPSTGAQREE